MSSSKTQHNIWLHSYQVNDEFDDDIYSSDSESEESTQAPLSKYEFDFEEEDEGKRIFKQDDQKLPDRFKPFISGVTPLVEHRQWSDILSQWNRHHTLFMKLEPMCVKYGVPKQVVKLLVSMTSTIEKLLSSEERDGDIRSIKLLNMKLKKLLVPDSIYTLHCNEYISNPSKFEVDLDTSQKEPGEAQAYSTPSSLRPRLQGRIKWVKRTDEEESNFDKDDIISDQQVDISLKDRQPAVSSPSVSVETAAVEEEWTPERIDSRFQQIIANRGMKHCNVSHQIRLLSSLMEQVRVIANVSGRLLQHLISLIDAHFDLNPSATSCLSIKDWKACYDYLAESLDLLENHQNQIFEGPFFTVEDRDPIFRQILTKLIHLDEEFIKGIQFVSVTSREYSLRLPHERALLLLLKRAEVVLSREDATLLAFHRLHYGYYRSEDPADQSAVEFLRDEPAYRAGIVCDQKSLDILKISGSEGTTSERSIAEDAQPSGESIPKVKKEELKFSVEEAEIARSRRHYNLSQRELELMTLTLAVDQNKAPIWARTDDMLQLCLRVYQSNLSNDHKLQTLLFEIYYLALHDEYQLALSLWSNRVQEEVQSAEPSIQLSYNRALAQIGLAAFRCGQLSDACAALQEFSVPSRVKELLAQGVVVRSTSLDKSFEKERAERRRQVVAAATISVEVLEFSYLASAMILDAASVASWTCGGDVRRRIISKVARKLLERFVGNGPPETTWDHVASAGRALFRGDYNKAYSLLASLDGVWSQIRNAENVKKILRSRIQEYSLVTYVWIHATHYTTLELNFLSRLFELDIVKIRELVLRLILCEDLQASLVLDADLPLLKFHSNNTTRSQFLALQLTDKLLSSIESDNGGDGPNGISSGGKDRWISLDDRPNRSNWGASSSGHQSTSRSSYHRRTGDGFKGSQSSNVPGSGRRNAADVQQ